MTRISIDPNVRVRGGLTYSGFEDIDGELPLDGLVEVYEPEGDLLGSGKVVDVDDEAQLVYVEVEWSSLRPRLEPLGNNVRLLSAQASFAVLNISVHNEAATASVEARIIRTRPNYAQGTSTFAAKVGAEYLLTSG